MKIFLSWSGEQSKQLALILKEWLPNVLQSCVPWMSDRDISAGERWGLEIARSLDECNFGIICVTRENINSAWIAFEAGALSKSLSEGKVVPLLFDLDYSDIQGSLSQFQSKKITKDSLTDLAIAINTFCVTPISIPVVNQAVNAHWKSLQSRLSDIQTVEKESIPTRTTKEILDEVLQIVRNIDHQVETARFRPSALRRSISREENKSTYFELDSTKLMDAFQFEANRILKLREPPQPLLSLAKEIKMNRSNVSDIIAIANEAIYIARRKYLSPLNSDPEILTIINSIESLIEISNSIRTRQPTP